MVKQRQSYTRSDESDMWMFIYEKIREGDRMGFEPKGLKIWETYIDKCKVSRTADSLCTRFRRHMSKNLHFASLQCHVMMFLYKRLRFVIAPAVKFMLEQKFSIEITLNNSGTLNTFKKVERNVAQNCALSPMSVTGGSVSDENVSNEVLDLTSSPLKRPSLNFTQEIHDVIEENRLQRRFRKRSDSRGAAVSNTRLSPIQTAYQDLEDAAPGPSRMNSSFEQDIVAVSTTSESCEEAFNRLYNAFVGGSDLGKTTNRHQSQVSDLTNQWQFYMSKMINMFNFDTTHRNKITATAFGEQPQYRQLIAAIKQCIKAELNDLTKNRSMHQLQLQRSQNSEFVLAIQHYDDPMENQAVPITTRKRYLKKAVDEIDLRLHSNHIVKILRQLMEAEALAAQIPEKYADSMVRVTDAVKRRVYKLCQGLIVP